VAELLADGVTRDVTRKELVGEDVTWRVHARDGAPGLLTVFFAGGALVALRLGPVPEDER
ncbi:MAG TPA: hypothetical protein VK935_09035, partial [Actinomycetospora sp.]|nr:hypothetical protein [Actinomycetospora sp.]